MCNHTKAFSYSLFSHTATNFVFFVCVWFFCVFMPVPVTFKKEKEQILSLSNHKNNDFKQFKAPSVRFRMCLDPCLLTSVLFCLSECVFVCLSV